MTRFLKYSPFALLAAFLSFHPIFATEIPHGDPAELGFSAEGLAKIQPAMQALVDSGKFAGVLTLIARKGKIIHFETAGLRDRESNKPMTEDTLFRIYSMTKPVTSVAIMMLYEEGKLKLDDPVSKFIPEFADTKVYTGGGTENPILTPLEREITIADLLSHKSGLTYGIFGQTSVDTLYRIANLYASNSNVKYAQKVAQLPLRFQPGTRWLYSVATDILGSVVEVASGMSLGEFFSQRIFVPLEMVDTSFYVPEEKRDRLATVYGKDDEGNLEARSLRSNTRRDARESGGGGLVGTARDYLRFSQMLLNGGELYGTRILKPETIQLMTANHLPETARYRHRQRKSDGFGYGFSVIVDETETAWEDRNGTYYWSGIAKTHFWIDPQNEMISMVWTQLRGSGNITRSFQPLVYKALVE